MVKSNLSRSARMPTYRGKAAFQSSSARGEAITLLLSGALGVGAAAQIMGCALSFQNGILFTVARPASVPFIYVTMNRHCSTGLAGEHGLRKYGPA
ncbi:MAG: hypothetical protein KC502_05955 [Myxococcales bacterium]|nr:hypothetical protein [Myxococcales bacterium]